MCTCAYSTNKPATVFWYEQENMAYSIKKDINQKTQTHILQLAWEKKKKEPASYKLNHISEIRYCRGDQFLKCFS